MHCFLSTVISKKIKNFNFKDYFSLIVGESLKSAKNLKIDYCILFFCTFASRDYGSLRIHVPQTCPCHVLLSPTAYSHIPSHPCLSETNGPFLRPKVEFFLSSKNYFYFSETFFKNPYRRLVS